MATALTNPAQFKAIADAIRAKTGLTGTIKASEFASKIAAIPTGVEKPKWIRSTLPTADGWASVCYGGGKFVAIAIEGSAAYSTDGINWTQSTLPTATDASWWSVCYGNGKFVAITS